MQTTCERCEGLSPVEFVLALVLGFTLALILAAHE